MEKRISPIPLYMQDITIYVHHYRKLFILLGPTVSEGKTTTGRSWSLSRADTVAIPWSPGKVAVLAGAPVESEVAPCMGVLVVVVVENVPPRGAGIRVALVITLTSILLLCEAGDTAAPPSE